MAYGRCKLTGRDGKLVKSHLLPKSVTRTPEPGLPRVDGYNCGRPVKRFDSWYDPFLVTRAGEDILSDYDDWAVKELRRLKLIWSSWADLDSLPTEDVQSPQESTIDLRPMQCKDVGKLRLFFLSLLWRAASTSLGDYRIPLSSDNIETLRKMIVSRDPEPFFLFPVTLIQLTTKGPWHIAGPRLMHLPLEDKAEEPTPFFRFYFDGLVAHIYDDVTDRVAQGLGPLALRNDPQILVLARPFEDSAQHEWLQEVITVVGRDHFETVERIFGRGERSDHNHHK